ncbi:neural-cadherin-like [Antedon mediterranea]|uniref:neural-cadherin-like n=1 Tax=Antedon mediterranea TaxID=105859 RepID=UPI003AF47288
MHYWILYFVFLLLFHELLLKCNCEIIWSTDFDNGCNSRFQPELSSTINVSQSVTEGMPVGSIIYNVSSLNLYELEVSFLKGSSHNKFSVTETGAIVLEELLDFETNQREYVEVILFKNEQGEIINVHLEINVLDVDEPPSWTMSFQPYKAQISSSSDSNDVVYQLSAVDPEYQEDPVVYGLFSDPYNLFKVNSETGEIKLKYKPSSKVFFDKVLRITVTVTEKGSTQNRNAADIFIYTSPQPPQFTQERYVASIDENNVQHAMLTEVKARSFQPSDGNIFYSMTRQPDDVKHSIHPNGTVTVISQLDREYRTGYTLLVKATDSIGQFTIAEILVLINDVNDNAPQFSQDVYTFIDIREDHDITRPVGRVQVSDPDADSNGIYYISSNTSMFRVHQQYGDLYPLESLDYETNHEHRFRVKATDLRGRFTCAYVIITVKNIPDEKPTFSEPFYKFEVDRNAYPGYNIGQVFAYDPNGKQIGYSLKPEDASRYFDIEGNSGILRLGKLDNDTAESLDPSYRLTVKARRADSERGGLQSAFIEDVFVIVDMKDLNKHVPEFPDCTSYSPIKIQEAKQKGIFVINIIAVDSDKGKNGEVKFSLNDISSEAFTIKTLPGNKGIIRTRKSFDRELQSNYNVTVIATDQASEYQLRNTCTIHVDVMDINDNSPKFDFTKYSRKIDVNTEVGTELLKIQAQDPDDGDEELSYTLYPLNENENIDYFTLESGRLILKKSLPSDSKKNKWTLTGRATDSVNQYDTTRIVISIVSQTADPLPTWRIYPPIKKSILENRNQNEYVFTVKADGKVTYMIDEQSLHTFSIDTNGTVRVNQALDCESVNTYQLTIGACDLTEEHCLYATVNISVLDVNEAPRFFLPGSLSANIVERPETKEDVLKLQAYDYDSQNIVGYSGRCEVGNNDCDFFKISKNLKTIKGAEYDRESKASYHFSINADDSRPPELEDNRTFTVNVLDLNDNFPEFEKDSYNVVLKEDTMVNTVVLTVSATDADTDKVEHLLLYGNTNRVIDSQIHTLYKHDTFKVDSATGEIILSKRLDFESIQLYQLTYAATDGVHNTTTTLRIEVTDVNDEAPRFSQPRYEVSISEGTVYTQETTLLTILATEDVDPFGSIWYSLYGVRDGAFTIDRLTGDLNITRQLDRELRTDYTFLVIATDGNGEGLSSATEVTIRVKDINDNIPLFLSPQYIGNIDEDLPVGTFVTRISATDADTGGYADIAYSLSPSSSNSRVVNNDIGGLFKVAPSGDITTLSVFDREEQNTYFLEVLATDTDSNAAATCTVTISIMDINDNQPTFQDVSKAKIPEGVDIGYSVATIYAQDMDIGENAEISFSLIGDESSTFLLDVNPVNKQNAVIRVNKILHYQDKNTYSIAFNASQAKFSRRFNVTVDVEDVNDYAPRFTKNSWNVSVLENVIIGTNLVAVTATDQDPGFNGVIRYSITGSDKLFDIDSVNGSIYVKGGLDREKEDSHTIIVVAQDQGSPSSSTSTAVHIKVLDVNDNGPLIRMEHDPVVLDTVVPPYQVVLIKAMDIDEVQNQGPFSFELICSDDPDICSYFALIDQNDNTSILQIKAKLDSKVRNKYIIRVRIQDSGKPPQSSNNTVTVIVKSSGSDSDILFIIIGTCAGVFLLLIGCCCCVCCCKRRNRCSLRKSYDVAGYTQTYQSFTLGLSGGMMRVGGGSNGGVDAHRRKLARRSLTESDHGDHGQHSFGMELNSLCLSNDKLTTLCEENEKIDREFYHSDSSLDLVSTVSFSVEAKTSNWVKESRARTLRPKEDMHEYNHVPPTFTFRTKHRTFTPTYV